MRPLYAARALYNFRTTSDLFGQPSLCRAQLAQLVSTAHSGSGKDI